MKAHISTFKSIFHSIFSVKFSDLACNFVKYHNLPLHFVDYQLSNIIKFQAIFYLSELVIYELSGRYLPLGPSISLSVIELSNLVQVLAESYQSYNAQHSIIFIVAAMQQVYNKFTKISIIRSALNMLSCLSDVMFPEVVLKAHCWLPCC